MKSKKKCSNKELRQRLNQLIKLSRTLSKEMKGGLRPVPNTAEVRRCLREGAEAGERLAARYMGFRSVEELQAAIRRSHELNPWLDHPGLLRE